MKTIKRIFKFAPVATIYLISGLGADARVFKRLDFGNHELRFIEWLEPNQDESLQAYASRLAAQINTGLPILIGVSFGGMIAVEIAKTIDFQKVILISSAKNKREIPLLYRFFGRLGIHRLIPVRLLKHANMLTYFFFGMKTKAEKELLKGILDATDPVFLKWAINAIVHWQNDAFVPGLVHLHGDKDHILPIKNIPTVDFTISNGGHLMTFCRATEINNTLEVILNSKQ